VALLHKAKKIQYVKPSSETTGLVPVLKNAKKWICVPLHRNGTHNKDVTIQNVRAHFCWDFFNLFYEYNRSCGTNGSDILVIGSDEVLQGIWLETGDKAIERVSVCEAKSA